MEQKEFQSNYTLDIATYREFGKGYVGSKKIMIVFLILFALCGIAELWEKNYAYIFGFCGIWLLLMGIFKMIDRSKLQYNRSISANGGKPLHHTVTINQDGILIVEDDGNKSTYKFEQIIGMGETKNLIILKMKYNLGIIVQKDTLTGGTQEELVSYLVEKCANLKPKKLVKTQYARIFQDCMIGMIGLLVVLAIIFFAIDGQRMSNWEKTLEKNGYEVGALETYVSGRKISILQILEETQATYIYEFERRSDAEENIQTWAELETQMLEEQMEANDFAVDERKNNKKYVIEFDGEQTILIQKDNYVFYGKCDQEHQKDLEKLANLLGF